MAWANKMFYAFELKNGEFCIVSTDKKQMARWYALDYLKDKPQLTDKGYKAVVSHLLFVKKGSPRTSFV